MADFRNRSAAEARLARALARLNRQTANDIIDELGEEPRVENLPIGFWEDVQKRYVAVLLPLLETTFVESALQMQDEALVGVDWSLVNERAAEWARNYTFDLVKGINANSRDLLRTYVNDYYTQGLNLTALEDRITRLYGPVRAEMVAVTETTRAAVEGERRIVREVEALGLPMVAVWQTASDERVCPICDPKNGKVIRNGQYPPAHPRCRCWINHVPATEAAELESVI